MVYPRVKDNNIVNTLTFRPNPHSHPSGASDAMWTITSARSMQVSNIEFFKCNKK